MWSTALLLVIAACSVSATQRVAVIGGGVAGASAAHYIRQAIGEASIEVFERNQLGGRAQEQDCDGVLVELGASIVWHKNYLVKDLAAAAGLECVSPPSDGLLAVYDGKELVFEQSTWGIVSLLRLILRYGFSWWSFRSAPAAMFEKFTGIYPLLDNGTTFDRPEQLLKALGLYEYTQASLFEYLRENYGSSLDLLAKELIAGVNKVNYNQNNMQINALAGHVSLLPATEPSVFKIKGGNSQLASRVLQVANATVHCPAAVAAVQRLADGRFQLELQKQAGHGCPAGDVQAGAGQCAESPSGATAPQPFDAVVVATPLEGSGLTFPGVHLPVIPARKFQQTVTTVIKGAVRPSYFGLSAMTYSAVMVTEEAAVPWSSLSLLGRTASDNVTLWKLFSSERLPHAWTEMMFEAGYEVVVNRTWNAYPQFDPPEDMAPFKLADGLFYAAALENAASAMEVAAIEGRMTAALAVKHLRAAAAAQQAGQGPQLVQAGAERAAEAGAAAAA